MVLNAAAASDGVDEMENKENYAGENGSGVGQNGVASLQHSLMRSTLFGVCYKIVNVKPVKLSQLEHV